MVPNDQMAIASITKTVVAAQVMQLVEAGELGLDDLAADRLPPDLKFDTNGATIVDLLSMRSGIPDYFADDGELVEVVTNDPLHVWTLEEKLATVAPKRGPVGQDREWEYIGTNYLLLGLIIEHATGRSIARGAAQRGPLGRWVRAPDLPARRAADRSDGDAARCVGRHVRQGGGYLPSIANATMFTSEGAMASDALSLARWFRALCAGQVVSPASLDEMTDFASDLNTGWGSGTGGRIRRTVRGIGPHGPRRGRDTEPRRCAFRTRAWSSWCWQTQRSTTSTQPPATCGKPPALDEVRSSQHDRKRNRGQACGH